MWTLLGLAPTIGTALTCYAAPDSGLVEMARHYSHIPEPNVRAKPRATVPDIPLINRSTSILHVSHYAMRSAIAPDKPCVECGIEVTDEAVPRRQLEYGATRVK